MMFHHSLIELDLFVDEDTCSSCVEEYLKQLNGELEKLAEMIHGDTVNEGRRFKCRLVREFRYPLVSSNMAGWQIPYKWSIYRYLQ